MKSRRILGIEKHSDQWVAIDPKENKVIVGGKNLDAVMRKASKILKKPVFMRVPRLDSSFAPLCQ